jgi:hypothetical protein
MSGIKLSGIIITMREGGILKCFAYLINSINDGSEKLDADAHPQMQIKGRLQCKHWKVLAFPHYENSFKASQREHKLRKQDDSSTSD